MKKIAYPRLTSKLEVQNDFINFIQEINANPIDLSKYKRELVKIRDKQFLIYKNLNFTRRTYYKHESDPSVKVQVSMLEYPSGVKEYFILFQYIIDAFPMVKNLTTITKRQKIDYYLKKIGFKPVKR